MTMQKLHFSIEIYASKEKVWNTLWEDTTLRDWANIIDEGMYMAGETKEGAEVQFISEVGGYGVTSLIETYRPNEFVLFRHMADTKDKGTEEREPEWTGGQESYSLTEQGGTTTLTIEMDAPPEQVETFKERLPKALKRVKELAENLS